MAVPFDSQITYMVIFRTRLRGSRMGKQWLSDEEAERAELRLHLHHFPKSVIPVCFFLVRRRVRHSNLPPHRDEIFTLQHDVATEVICFAEQSIQYD